MTPFSMIAIPILSDPRMTGSLLKVFGAIASFQGNHPYAWCGHRGIAKRSGVHRGSISRCVKKIESFGYLTVIKGDKTNSGHKYIVAREIECSIQDDQVAPTGIKNAASEKVRKEYKRSPKKTKPSKVEKPKPKLVEIKSEQIPNNEILTEIQPQVSDMNNETRLDIGYEQKNVDWNEIQKLRDEEERKKAEWKKKDEVYGRYLFQISTGTTEEQWRASLLNSDFTVEEFENIKREWEGRRAV